MACSAPDLIWPISATGGSIRKSMPLAEQLGQRLVAAAERHHLNLDAGEPREIFDQQMLRRARAGHAAEHRLGARLRGLDQVGDVADRVLGIGHDHEREFDRLADDGEVVDRLIRQRLVGRGGDGVAARNPAERIAVRRGARDLRRRERAGRAGLRLDHDLLAEPRDRPSAISARADIDAAARGQAVDQGNVALRPGREARARAAARRRRTSPASMVRRVSAAMAMIPPCV